jgi:hypothetical protein
MDLNTIGNLVFNDNPHNFLVQLAPRFSEGRFVNFQPLFLIVHYIQSELLWFNTKGVIFLLHLYHGENISMRWCPSPTFISWREHFNEMMSPYIYIMARTFQWDDVLLLHLYHGENISVRWCPSPTFISWREHFNEMMSFSYIYIMARTFQWDDVFLLHLYHGENISMRWCPLRTRAIGLVGLS